MKKQIAILLLAAFSAGAQLQYIDLVTPHTNSYTTAANISIVSKGITNAPYQTTNYVVVTYGDSAATANAKLNYDLNYLTNLLGTGLSISFTNPVTGAPGTSVLVTNYGTSIAAVIQLTIPAGNPGTNGTNGVTGPAGPAGTNTVTMMNFSNQVLSSQRILTYSTNYAFWSASNYLARVNGIYNWNVSGGDDGGNPPTPTAFHIIGSFNGSNSWFTITNGFQTTNFISIVLIRDGAAPVDPGGALLYSVDHWELLGRTNYYFGQHQRFDIPSDPFDAATKSYADTLFANAIAGQWVASTDTNGLTHYTYSANGVAVADFGSLLGWIQINSSTLDGTGTNITFAITATNLVAGWHIESSTNLALINGWTTWTNYSTNITSGVVTFKVPINPLFTAQFFRARGAGQNGFTVTPPITALGGTIYPSNTWSLASITNVMPNFSFWAGTSNGQALVSIYLSNGVPWVKRLAP